MTPEIVVTPVNGGPEAYVIATGTAPDGEHPLIALEPDGSARLSDETVERIAARTARLLIGMLVTGAQHWNDR